MSAEVTGGLLGPRALAELRALAAQREQVEEQYRRVREGLAAKETTLLAVAAEAQGCESAGPYDYDLAAGTWCLVVKPVEDDG